MPPNSSNAKNTRRNIAVAAGLAILLAVGGFLFHQQSSLAKSRAQVTSLQDQLATSQGQVSDLNGQLTTSKDQLATSKGQVSDLNGQVSDLNGQVSACANALSDGVHMDTALNDKVDNVLFNGSLAQFYNLIRKYNAAGELWVTAANQCDPGGGYTFG